MHATTTAPPPLSTAARLLFAAYFVDDVDLAPADHDWLAQRLADLSWTPTVQECADFRPRLLAWASRYDHTRLAVRVLAPVRPAPPLTRGPWSWTTGALWED